MSSNAPPKTLILENIRAEKTRTPQEKSTQKTSTFNDLDEINNGETIAATPNTQNKFEMLLPTTLPHAISCAP